VFVKSLDVPRASTGTLHPKEIARVGVAISQFRNNGGVYGIGVTWSHIVSETVRIGKQKVSHHVFAAAGAGEVLGFRGSEGDQDESEATQ